MNNPLGDTLRRGGAAVVRLDLEGWHDVLLTGIEGDEVRLFDPYYCEKPFGDPTLTRTRTTGSSRSAISSARRGRSTPSARWTGARRCC